ncbi:MAG: phosphatidate cytidylyltransferase [Coriobacteriales bacterium]|nr:phosphatidate cytidylyltransferase [Coriobacteriales bacterium]
MWLGVIIAAMAAFASWEFYQIARREQRLPNELFGVVAAAAMPVMAALLGLRGTSASLTALVALAIPWSVLYTRVRTADVAVTVFGSVYTGFMLSYLVLVRELKFGLILSFAFIVSVWASDVVAYFVGSLWGRHKLSPRISPKKSWEGFFGGFLATVAVWVAVPTLFPETGVTMWLALLTGAAVAVSALIGDLFESRVKREAGIKDSGYMLPGHGGFLDRLDSTIFASFVVYWVLWWGGQR